VDSHRIKSASAAESLKGGRLASVLRQATRSCLIRITNLTQYRLTMDGRGALDAQGFWVLEPPACIDAHTFSDMGISNNGLQLTTRGSLCYVVEGPENNRERRVQLFIDWDVPWIRQKTLKARDAGEIMAVKTFTDRQQNLVGLIHIIDPRNLPMLEVLDSVALASNTDSGEDMTEIVREIARPFELVIPSVRVLLGRAKRIRSQADDGEKGSHSYTGLQISYRIGPEVFRRVYAPGERVHLSAAQPGGDGEEETVLAALEARGEEHKREAEPELGPQDQALLLQSELAEGMMPSIRKGLKSVPKADWPHVSHWWPPNGSEADCGETEVLPKEALVLDAAGVLQVLHGHWGIVSRRIPAAREIDEEELLFPLDDLVDAWMHQADLEPALVREAAAAGSALCLLFGAEEAAANIEQLAAGQRPAPRKVGSPVKDKPIKELRF